ncbi:helix-turn-helix domain-containing protein [Nocardia panacis]|nr:helix-turn-helix transcriptional regulator [Nocardia panacis]
MKEWRTGALFDALAAKDMAQVVWAYRHHRAHGRRPLTQADMARWLGITQGQLSRIENGRNRIRSLDTLTHYARCLQIPHALCWFDIDEPDTAPVAPTEPVQVRLPGGRRIPAATMPSLPAQAESLLTTLDQYVVTDMLSGPHPLLPVVEHQLWFIDRLIAGSRGSGRQRLLYVSARYAEFMGWLRHDEGDLHAALHWSNAAFDLVKELGDTRFLSYVQMRKSNIASDIRKPDLAIVFAKEALSNLSLTPRQRAVALRQLAHGYAMLGEQEACVRALDQAHAAADEGENDPGDMSGYCTPEYIAMEAAHCWVQLGRPEAALDDLQHGLENWKPGNRRDLGVGLARLAAAYAGLGQPDEANEVAGHALVIVAETRSSRTIQQLHQVTEKLTQTGHLSHARELDHALRRTLRRPEAAAPMKTRRTSEWN